MKSLVLNIKQILYNIFFWSEKLNIIFLQTEFEETQNSWLYTVPIQNRTKWNKLEEARHYCVLIYKLVLDKNKQPLDQGPNYLVTNKDIFC